MEKSSFVDMDGQSVSSNENDQVSNQDILTYHSLNDSSTPLKISTNYLGRSRVFLDGHMSIDKSTGVTVIYCSYCPKSWTAPKSSSTGNYRKHLLKHHPYELSGKDGVVGQVRLRDGLLRWMIGSLVGIETFDDNFNSFLRNSFHVEIGKSRLSQSLVEILEKQYDTLRVKVQSFFRPQQAVATAGPPIASNIGSSHVALSFHSKTITGFTDNNSFIQANFATASGASNYVTIAGHFINDQWLLKNVLFSFVPIRGTPTHKNLAFVLSENVIQYVDSPQITTVVSTIPSTDIFPQDSSSHGLSKYKIFCIATKLQEVVNDAVIATTSIPSVIHIRSNVSEILSNPKNIDALNRIHVQVTNAQQSAGSVASEYTTIDLDRPTENWRSTLKFLNGVLEQNVVLDTFTNQLGRSLSLNPLTPEEWKEISIIRSLIQSLETAIAALTNPNQDVPTLPTVLPSLGWLLDIIKDSFEGLPKESALSSLYTLLQGKILQIYQEVKQSHIYAIATALDPRLKLDFFEDRQWSEDEKNAVVSELGNLYSFYTQSSSDLSLPVGLANEEYESNNDTSKSQASSVFYKRRKLSQRQEWEVYLGTPVSCVDKQDPLSWWKEHSSSYPILSRLIKDIFAIPSSVAFAETNVNQGLELISRLRSHKVLALHKRDNRSVPVHRLSTSSSDPRASFSEEVVIPDENSVEQLLTLRSWTASIILEE